MILIKKLCDFAPLCLCGKNQKTYLYKMVLVTGGTGLVGAHLLLHLIENGDNVRAIYRNKKKIERTKSVFDLYKKFFLSLMLLEDLIEF